MRDEVPAKKARSSCKDLIKWEEAYLYLKKGNASQRHAFCKMFHGDLSFLFTYT